MKVINNHPSEFPILSNWNEDAWKKKIRTSTKLRDPVVILFKRRIA